MKIKTKTVFFTSATIGVLFAALAITLLSNWSVPYVYAQDITQLQPTTVPQTIQATVQNVVAAGTERTDSFGIKQVYVPAGCFMMGSTDIQVQDAIAQFTKNGYPQSLAQQLVAGEVPQHQVCITQGYWLDEFDVTNAAFDAFVKANGYSSDSLWSSDGLNWKQTQKISWPDRTCAIYSNVPNQPRVCVSYYEAEAYARWRTCRLPTEAEWEYAARGPKNSIYPWGDTFDQSKANLGHSREITTVDAYPTGKSWVGAYDMAGNVWQWVADWYSDTYYSSNPTNDPAGPTSGTFRAMRGSAIGSMSSSDTSDQASARAASRGNDYPNSRDGELSFRLVCSASSAGATQITAPALAITPISAANGAATAAPTASANTLAAVIERTDSSGIKQVYVPVGCFMMGTDPSKDRWADADEQPQHQVCITKPYWLDEFDVTNAAFDAFVKTGGYNNNSLWSNDGLNWKQGGSKSGPDTYAPFGYVCTGESDPNKPRVCVSYYEAEAYAKWRTCRLPTEAEWEYAARGTDGRIYPWGDTFDKSKANTNDSGIGKSTAVDAYPTGKSWVGAYDIVGNVVQWVADWYDASYYDSSDKNDPTGPSTGQYRVLRGNAYDNNSIGARAANRSQLLPAYQVSNIGFRVVCSVPAVGAMPATVPAVTISPTTAANVPVTAAPTVSATAFAAVTERADSFVMVEGAGFLKNIRRKKKAAVREPGQEPPGQRQV